MLILELHLSDSGYKENIKAEIFEMIGKIKGRSAKASVVWKYIVQ
jgi:hypothetical protein